jgi:hypothetical protein
MAARLSRKYQQRGANYTVLYWGSGVIMPGHLGFFQGTVALNATEPNLGPGLPVERRPSSDHHSLRNFSSPSRGWLCTFALFAINVSLVCTKKKKKKLILSL